MPTEEIIWQVLCSPWTFVGECIITFPHMSLSPDMACERHFQNSCARGRSMGPKFCWWKHDAKSVLPCESQCFDELFHAMFSSPDKLLYWQNQLCWFIVGIYIQVIYLYQTISKLETDLTKLFEHPGWSRLWNKQPVWLKTLQIIKTKIAPVLTLHLLLSNTVIAKWFSEQQWNVLIPQAFSIIFMSPRPLHSGHSLEGVGQV